MFDPDFGVDFLKEIFEEQFILGSDLHTDLKFDVEGFEIGFEGFTTYQRAMSSSFFGYNNDLFSPILDWADSKILFNKYSNSKLFETDIESFTKKLCLSQIWRDSYEQMKAKVTNQEEETILYCNNRNYAPHGVGSFLLICLGLLNHQKTIYIDVPSKGQKRETSFGEVVPRKEYRIVNIKLSDQPKIIERELSSNFPKERKKMGLHEMPQIWRKSLNGRPLLHAPCGVSINGKSSRGCNDCWIRVRPHFRGDKKYGEIHTDIQVTKDKKGSLDQSNNKGE